MMPQDVAHKMSQAFERLGDENKVVVRCIDCGNIMIADFYYWPTEEELTKLRTEHGR